MKNPSPSISGATFVLSGSELMNAILAGGGKVYVCKHCAEVSGVDLSTLLPGVIVSEHGSLLDELAPGMLSFSY